MSNRSEEWFVIKYDELKSKTQAWVQKFENVVGNKNATSYVGFDDWQTVEEDGELEQWIAFNGVEYIGYILEYHQGVAEDQGAHGDPWLNDKELERLTEYRTGMREILQEVLELNATCKCRRCMFSSHDGSDYCYEIAYNIDEDGNYHDDEGNFRDGQSHEVIA